MTSYLTANDAEPDVGTQVATVDDVAWERHPVGYWLRLDSPDGEPESWVKLAGNYGPVREIA